MNKHYVYIHAVLKQINALSDFILATFYFTEENWQIGMKDMGKMFEHILIVNSDIPFSCNYY